MVDRPTLAEVLGCRAQAEVVADVAGLLAVVRLGRCMGSSWVGGILVEGGAEGGAGGGRSKGMRMALGMPGDLAGVDSSRSGVCQKKIRLKGGMGTSWHMPSNPAGITALACNLFGAVSL